MKIRNLLDLPNELFGATEVDVLDRLRQNEAGARAFHGQFSIFHQDPENIWLVRDPLGLNKMFYVLDHEQHSLTVGNSLYEVAQATGDFNHIVSVLPGHYVKINRGTLESKLVCYYDISQTSEIPEADFHLADFHSRARQRLTTYFENLAVRHPDATFVVCLSGGLDSTLIATYAKRFLKTVLATTFSYVINSRESEDFAAARAIAEALGLEFLPIIRKRAMDENRLKTVLRHCQDWRDFNVHCAWLNDQIGEDLRQRYPNRKLIVLTGDLMNEYVADYTPVNYGGVEYYRQPRISRDRLRRFFVYGLDTSDREIGIFHRHGVSVRQAYSILAEEYLAVPASVIDHPQCKEMLNLPLIANAKAEALVGRAKVRAQVGGKDGGSLGLFHDSGVTQAVLKEQWEALFASFCREGKPREIIVAGRYIGTL